MTEDVLEEMAIEDVMDDTRMGPVSTALVLLLIALLVAAGVCSVAIAIMDNGKVAAPDVADAMLLVLGLIMLAIVKKPARHIILVFTLGYALIDFCTLLALVLQGETIATLARAIFDVLAIFAAIHYFIGDHHSINQLSLVFAMFFVIQLITIAIIAVTVLLLGKSTLELVPPIVEGLVLLVFIILIMRPSIREGSLGKIMNANLLAVESLFSDSPEACIRRQDVDGLLGIDRSNWVPGEADGPIDSIHTAKIYDKKREFLVTSKIWKGEDEIRISIEQDLKSKTFGRSFVLKGHVEETDGENTYLRLYGHDGFFLRILIMEPTDDSVARQIISNGGDGSPYFDSKSEKQESGHDM